LTARQAHGERVARQGFHPQWICARENLEFADAGGTWITPASDDYRRDRILQTSVAVGGISYFAHDRAHEEKGPTSLDAMKERWIMTAAAHRQA